MDKHYILTSSSCIFHGAGDRTAVIGSMEGCDFRLPDASSAFCPVVAKIKPDTDGRGWHIIRCSPTVAVFVNGEPIRRVCYLTDGDVIETGGNRFRFNELREANERHSVIRIEHRSSPLTKLLAILVLAIAAVGAFLIYDYNRERITGSMAEEIASSMFMTRVDSIQLVDVASGKVLESFVYETPPVGSAFLTTDSLLVTARHCLQPWLNAVNPVDFGRLPTLSEWPIARALAVETANQISGTDSLRLRSFITLTDENGHQTAVSSDRFTLNTSDDDIVELGDYSTPLYWRSISHRYRRCDMMLGDIAATRFNRAGSIALADSADLRRLLREGKRLTFFGYPVTGVNGARLEHCSDELRLPLSDLTEQPGRLMLLSHEGGLTPGYSGGPVIVRDRFGFRAVGIVSVVDDKRESRSYSVPSSEINTLK